MGFALQMGGVGGVASLGGAGALANEFTITLGGKEFGLFGTTGFFLSGSAYDASIFTLFLFQMVFMNPSKGFSQHADRCGNAAKIDHSAASNKHGKGGSP